MSPAKPMASAVGFAAFCERGAAALALAVEA